MKYALLLYGDAEHDRRWAEADDAERAAQYAKHGEFAEMLTKRNAMVGGNELALSHTATTVRHAGGGDVVVTDGPFAEITEQLGGYYEIEARDLDEALEFARAVPSPTVEVRPIVEQEAAS